MPRLPYSHWTGRRQVCSRTSARPGVLARHSMAAPASPMSGVSTVELTRRPPDRELCKHVRDERRLLHQSGTDLGLGAGQLLPIFPPWHLVIRPGPPDLVLTILCNDIIVYYLTSHSSRRDTPTTRGTSVRRIWTESGGTANRRLTPTHYANAEKTLLNWVKYQIHFITIKVCAFISGSLIRQIIRENIYEGEITRAKICSIDHKEPFLQSMYFSMIGVGWPRSSDTSNNVSIWPII